MQQASNVEIPEWAKNLSSAYDEKLGLVYEEISMDCVRAKAPVKGNTQPFGFWHGGASATLVETVGSTGALLYAHPNVVVGTELNISHHRPGTGEWIHAEARPLHLGRTTTNHEVRIFDENGQHLATGRISCRIVDLEGRPI